MVYLSNRIPCVVVFLWMALGFPALCPAEELSSVRIGAMQSSFKNRIAETRDRLNDLEQRLLLGSFRPLETKFSDEPVVPEPEPVAPQTSYNPQAWRSLSLEPKSSSFLPFEIEPLPFYPSSRRGTFLPPPYGPPLRTPPSALRPPAFTSDPKTPSSFPQREERTSSFSEEIPMSVPLEPRVPSKALPPPVAPEATYLVNQILLSYGGDIEGLPAFDPLSEVRFRGDGPGAPVIDLGVLLAKNPKRVPMEVRARDLRQISEIIVQFLKSEGFEGMVALVDPAQIDPTSGKDLRSQQNYGLTFRVWVARINEVTLQYESSIQQGKRDRLKKLESVTSGLMNHHNVLGQPLDGSFKRSLRRLGRSPARTSRLLLTPSERPGEVEAVVQIKDQKNLSLSAGASNSGSPTTGEWLFRGNLRAHQLTRREDPADFSWMFSDTGQRLGLGGGYVLPLVQPGVLDLSLRTAYKEYDGSSFAVTQIDFEGKSWLADLSLLGSPLGWETEAGRVTYELGFTFDKTQSYNSILFDGRANFLSFRMGLARHRSNEIIRSVSSLVLRSNLSSVPLLDREAMGGFEVVERAPVLAWSHTTGLNLGKIFGWGEGSFGPADRHLLVARFSGSGSLTGDRMLPRDQAILGGASGVRGYPESCVAGDYAYWLSLEYRWKAYASDRLTLTLAPFFEFGQSFVVNPFSYEADNTLCSLGLGLAVDLPMGAYLRLDYATPLQEVANGFGEVRRGTQSGDHRIHASTQWMF